MASPERQELLRNAVVFLRDPKTQSSPLAQRVQFLEAKGLNSSEIEEAMRQASAGLPLPLSTSQQYGAYPPAYGPVQYTAQPPHQWDWRDYFITAIVSGTVMYGAAALFKKYVKPHLHPPSATAYEADRDALSAQFDVAEAMLKEIQAETAAVRVAVEEQTAKVGKVTQEVEVIVGEMRESEQKTRTDLHDMKDEIQHIREMVPKMIEKNKEGHNQSLAELQQELKSLKALLLSRGPGSVSGATTPIIPSKPSIPAWQLSGSNHYSNTSLSLPASPGPPTIPTASGKGKEVDLNSNGSSA
ncbi:hypothetical protein PHLGIDRAFT_27265 [Phlebiopsis gigantea 11061_1 CR5-6]|uniref:Peroxisomal membrane protein PEX14 n=1 Tax=Phlebiopsis gigantea (strain 11061_1 CR5-6) TaxID=745531 RepID=A0A0C3SFP3_PHLG1|nr:hypothetical protein PHLGIDRAFT_27265 [Phlebiopsis gigantea 11061_1 CR5-6]